MPYAVSLFKSKRLLVCLQLLLLLSNVNYFQMKHVPPVAFQSKWFQFHVLFTIIKTFVYTMCEWVQCLEVNVKCECNYYRHNWNLWMNSIWCIFIKKSIQNTINNQHSTTSPHWIVTHASKPMLSYVRLRWKI